MDDDKYLDLERRILQIEANLKEMFVQFKLIRNPDNLEQSSVKADLSVSDCPQIGIESFLIFHLF